MTRLTQRGWSVRAFSRNPPSPSAIDSNAVWLPISASPELIAPITHWVSLIPIWNLPDYFSLFAHSAPRRIVALSSTSRFTKENASDPADRKTASLLAEGEEKLIDWATVRGMEWVVLRPTLIYGGGQDQNISQVARVIRRIGFFPVLGAASGRRQPVHLDDVADACVSALLRETAAGNSYNLSGGETLTYRKMVERVCVAAGCAPRLVTVPLPAFRVAIGLLRRFPPFRHWSPAMAERMNQDLIFDHRSATRDLDYSPRPFSLSKEDVPC